MRVLGPYFDKSRKRRKWKLVLVNAGGERLPRRYETKEQAFEVKRDLIAVLNEGLQVTVGGAFEGDGWVDEYGAARATSDTA